MDRLINTLKKTPAAALGYTERPGQLQPPMNRKGQRNRARIIEAANRLFYHRGYNQTSFAEVAEASGIPKGNFYHYFRSKEELFSAVVEARMESIRGMLAEWSETYSDPRARLHRYVQILLNEADDVLRYGCPIGTLNVELGKVQLNLRSQAAEMFNLFLEWLEPQFHTLGKGAQSRRLALHLIALMQGASLISNVYGDRLFLEEEVARMRVWIEAL